jgi:hypothetical protein
MIDDESTERSSEGGITELAISVPSRLLELISPATPDTIKSSRLRKNVPLLMISVIGVFGFAALLYSASGSDPSGACNAKSVATCDIRFDRLVELIGGAILGSAFYALWTAREYLKDGTFSRAYSQVYVIRFGLGIVAGFILGSVAPTLPFLQGDAKNLTPLTFAIVGGFSAEAVVQILQRVADILVAAVRGSDKEQVKASADRSTAKKLNETAGKLTDAMQEQDPDKMKTALQDVMRQMLK